MHATPETHQKKRIDFIIGGTQKGGTTALFEYLAEHPEIQTPSQKELHYFDNDAIYENDTDYESYHQHFDFTEAGITCRGEATPIYMYLEPSPERIWQYNPQMKWILVLRNPIERAYSHWNMEFQKGRDTLDFQQALAAEDSRCRKALPLQHRVYSYVDRGFYSLQIRRILQFFPRTQLLVIESETLKNDHEAAISNCYEFLGTTSISTAYRKDQHKRAYDNSMSEEERNFLNERYHTEIQDLEALLGWNCSHWTSRTKHHQ
jgi:hypothetical protein